MDEKAVVPCQIWHIDHAGILVKRKGCTEIFVTVDAFSKYAMFTPIKDMTAKSCIKRVQLQFQEVVVEVVIPTKIIADRGRAFTSATFWEI